MRTSAIWLGNKRNSPVKSTCHIYRWSGSNPSRCNILGIWFRNTLKDCEEINLREKKNQK